MRLTEVKSPILRVGGATPWAGVPDCIERRNHAPPFPTVDSMGPASSDSYCPVVPAVMDRIFEL